MTKHRPQLQRFIRQAKMCGEKRCYPSKKEAELVKEERQIIHPGLTLRIYRCTLGCHSWHLTRVV